MQRQKYTPLTTEEQQFASDNHYLVRNYLRLRKLDIDEWYDVVIFRYLLAVKRWFSQPEIHRLKFSTIAYSGMRSAIGNECKKRDKQIRTVSLDVVLAGTEDATLQDTITHKNLNYIYIGGDDEMNISYNVKIPDKRRFGEKSDEVKAIETFATMKSKRNMCFEYDTVEEAKKKAPTLQAFKRKCLPDGAYEVFRQENKIYVVRQEGK